MIRRVGTPRQGVVEILLSQLHPLHPVPQPGVQPTHIANLALSIQANGYDVSQAIPVARMPGWTFGAAWGTPRAEAMRQLGETTIPARIVDLGYLVSGGPTLVAAKVLTFSMAGIPYMNTTRSAWYAYSLPNSTTLRCACCANEIDLQFPTAGDRPRVCPACGIACAFLNWQSRIIQIVPGEAPRPLAEVIRWAQKHLDELEYVNSSVL